MAYNLLRLSHYYENANYDTHAAKQLRFMITEASRYPSGYAMFLCALLDYVELPTKVTIVLKDKTDLEKIKGKLPLSAIVKILEEPTNEYPIKTIKPPIMFAKVETVNLLQIPFLFNETSFLPK